MYWVTGFVQIRGVHYLGSLWGTSIEDLKLQLCLVFEVLMWWVLTTWPLHLSIGVNANTVYRASQIAHAHGAYMLHALPMNVHVYVHAFNPPTIRWWINAWFSH